MTLVRPVGVEDLTDPMDVLKPFSEVMLLFLRYLCFPRRCFFDQFLRF